MRRKISDFLNNEYKQQAQNANFTKLPSIFGLKVTANKVIHIMITENINSFTKTETMSNITALKTLYIGGSKNIDGVIENLCSTYSGSNNISLLDKKGQIGGTRMNRNSASSRYTFVKKSKMLDALFNKNDLNILPRYNFEGVDIEYQFFTYNMPLIFLLRNSGMGSGHSSNIYPRDFNEIKTYLINKLNGKNEKFELLPHFNNFNGIVKRGENPNQYIIEGKIEEVSSTKTIIKEVPIDETYTSFIKKLDSLEEKRIIKKYDDECDFENDLFRFTIYHTKEFGSLSTDEKLKKLKLVKTITENYTVIDENNRVKVFKSPNDVFEYYYELKLYYLNKRKEFMIKDLVNKIKIDASKYIFIKSIIDKKLIINNIPKNKIYSDLEKIKNIIKVDDSYDYLLNMNIFSLTKERLAKLQNDINSKKNELSKIKEMSIKDMWLEDLKNL